MISKLSSLIPRAQSQILPFLPQSQISAEDDLHHLDFLHLNYLHRSKTCPKIHHLASFPSSSSFCLSFSQDSLKTNHHQQTLQYCLLKFEANQKKYLGDRCFKYGSYFHLLGQVRVSHQCAHLQRKEVKDEVIAGPEKNHAVIQKIDVKYGEVHHQMVLLLI